MKKLLFVSSLFVAIALALGACQPKEIKPAITQATPTPAAPTTAEDKASDGGLKTTPSGLQYQDLVVGNGPRPLFGQKARLHYTGWTADGIKFDSSLGKAPLEIALGKGEVIKGMEIGVGGGREIEAMRVGGKRKLIIPPDLGYGDQAMDPIPPNSTLIFEVELIGLK
jgi:peptidylprolyl isomerase